MPTKIVVPELGESIVEATVARWLKQEGDEVAVGEAVVELETDKVNLEVSAEQAGVLANIERQEGEDVEIGDVLGTIDEAAEEAGPSEEKEAEKEEAKDKEEPGDEEKAAVQGAGEDKRKEAGDKDEPDDEEKAAAQDAEEESDKEAEKEGEEKATPVAQRLAQEHGLDLADIPAGSGKRISKEDVERYLEKQSEAEAPEKKEKKEKEEKEIEKAEPTPEQEPRPEAEEPETEPQRERTAEEERVRMSRRRQTIASRLVEAQQTAAMLTTFNEIDMSAVTALRRRRRADFEERHGVRLGFMSFFVKAVIGALKQFPQLNAELDGNEIVLKHYYDIGMAVSTDEGLVVPVIRDADRLTFAEIEQHIVDYSEKAQRGRLSIPELRGGTFTITNGGVFGSLLSTPILNLPQVGILGLHKIEKRPVVVDDEIVIRPMMYVALSYDHRLIDGAEAVQFLVQVKTLIEEPEVLLLEG